MKPSRCVLSVGFVLLLGLASLGSVACRRHHPPFRRVVLITIDTLRADHLSSYGYPRPTSPWFAQLADQGVLFEHAIATMATTIPSHSAMFTSLYPIQTGVVQNSKVLADRYVTLAERFRRAGYATAAFVSARHLGAAHLNQGFDVYSQPQDEERHSRPGDKTINHALRWLAKQPPDQQFFVWIHLFDPHYPYRFHPKQQAMMESTRPMPDAQLKAFLVQREHIDPRTYNGDVRRMLHTVRDYDTEVRFADDQLQRFFQAVRRRGLIDDSLWIVTADHGEGLGDHLWMGHGKHIYNEQLHVPLLFWADDHRWKPRRVAPLVEHVDLVPTLIDIQKLDANVGQPMEGVSLRPLLRGQSKSFPDRRAFSQRRSFAGVKVSETDPLRRNYESGERYALQSLRYKYLLWTDGPDEFYDLRSDPFELNNQIGHGGTAERDFRRRLLHSVADYQRNAPRAESVEDRNLDALRALGYLQ